MSNTKEIAELKQLVISWLINHDVAENKLTSILAILSGHDASGADTNQMLIERLQSINPSFDPTINQVKLKEEYVYKNKTGNVSHLKVEDVRGIKHEAYTFDHELSISPPHHLTRKEGESPIPLQRLAELFNHRPNGGL